MWIVEIGGTKYGPFKTADEAGAWILGRRMGQLHSDWHIVYVMPTTE